MPAAWGTSWGASWADSWGAPDEGVGGAGGGLPHYEADVRRARRRHEKEESLSRRAFIEKLVTGEVELPVAELEVVKLVAKAKEVRKRHDGADWTKAAEEILRNSAKLEAAYQAWLQDEEDIILLMGAWP